MLRWPEHPNYIFGNLINPNEERLSSGHRGYKDHILSTKAAALVMGQIYKASFEGWGIYISQNQLGIAAHRHWFPFLLLGKYPDG